MTPVTLGAADSPLTTRAAEFLAAGPSDAQPLISYVCQLPGAGAPRHIAEHMATALFAGHTRFARDTTGRWHLREASAAYAVSVEPPLASTSFVVVDVETTGSRAYNGDRVTEVAAVLVRGDETKILFDSLVNPERPIPPQITRLTNITWAMVKRAPRFADVCDQLLGALEGHVFVAHNAMFDWRFLTMEVERATGRVLTGRRLCTVRMARHLIPELKRRSLDALARYYDIEITQRHRAGGDAVATARVLQRLLGVADDVGCGTVTDVEQLIADRRNATKKKKRRRRSALPGPVIEDTTA
jgi:DNA polymerase-3 subunit epsilon